MADVWESDLVERCIRVSHAGLVVECWPLTWLFMLWAKCVGLGHVCGGELKQCLSSSRRCGSLRVLMCRYRCLSLSCGGDHRALLQALSEKGLAKHGQWQIGHTKVWC